MSPVQNCVLSRSVARRDYGMLWLLGYVYRVVSMF